MGLSRAWLIVAAAVVATPAAASTGARNASGALCPQATPQQSAEIIDRRLQALDERLQRMDDTLQAQLEARMQVLEDTKMKIEEAVRRGDLTPEQIDAIVARAIDRASAKAKSTAKAADATRRAIEAIKPQVAELEKKLQVLGVNQSAKDDVDLSSGETSGSGEDTD